MTYLFRALFGATLIFLSLSSQAQAQEREYILDRAYVSDPTGSLTLEQVRDQAATPFKSVLTGGYGPGAIWVRLRIDPRLPNTNPSDLLFLRIRPAFLDHIQLYDQSEGYVPRPIIGDRHLMSSQSEPSTFFLLKLRAGDSPRELWLRLESTSTRMAYFELLDEPTLHDSTLKIQSVTSTYLAGITLFLGIGILQACARRDRLNLAFVFYQVVTLTNGVLSLGYARWLTYDWVSPEVLDGLFSLNAVGFLFGILFFSYALIRELTQSRLRTYVFFGLCTIPSSLIAMQFFGFIRLSLAINALTCLIMPTIFFIDTLFQLGKKTQVISNPTLSREVVIIYFGLSAIIAYLSVLPIMGWSQAVVFNLYAVHLYAFTSGVLMLWLLRRRTRIITQQRDSLVIEAQQAKELAALEHKQSVERQRLLDMLGHELRTPITTLKMLLGHKSISKEWAQRLRKPLTEMNEVVERTIQFGQIENGDPDVRWEKCNLVDLIQEQISNLPDHHRVTYTLNGNAQQAVVIQTDPHFLGIVIRNLIDNALKYSPDNSTVTLSLHQAWQEDTWSLTVENEVGRAGRPDSEKIFTRYWRSPNATYRSGSGLGLYIAHRLTNVLGGLLTLESDTSIVSLRLAFPVDTKLKNMEESA